MPYTIGDGEIPVDQIDLAVEVDESLPTHTRRLRLVPAGLR